MHSATWSPRAESAGAWEAALNEQPPELVLETSDEEGDSDSGDGEDLGNDPQQAVRRRRRRERGGRKHTQRKRKRKQHEQEMHMLLQRMAMGTPPTAVPPADPVLPQTAPHRPSPPQQNLMVPQPNAQKSHACGDTNSLATGCPQGNALMWLHALTQGALQTPQSPAIGAEDPAPDLQCDLSDSDRKPRRRRPRGGAKNRRKRSLGSEDTDPQTPPRVFLCSPAHQCQTPSSITSAQHVPVLPAAPCLGTWYRPEVLSHPATTA